MHGLEVESSEINADENFSKYLYSPDDNPNKLTQDQLIVKSSRNVDYSSKVIGHLPYTDIGLASGEMNFENDWKVLRDPTWRTKMKFITVSEIGYSRYKPYNADLMNNYANNTKPSEDDQGGYPEIINYFNFYHDD